jgi:hypothetical protein
MVTPGRRLIQVRVSWPGYDLIKTRAVQEADGNLSEMIRRLLKYATITMPKDWK